MKRLTTACLAIVLAGLMTISPVWAHGGGGHGGGFGGGGGGHYGGGYGGGGHYGGYGGGHYGGGYYGGYRGGYYGGIGIYGLGLGYYGWPYYSPYYAYPPAVVQVPSSPPVYIEQGGGQVAPAQAPQSQSGYWYYCADSRAYYPYVKECPAGWQQVAPQPPPPR